MIVGTQGIMVGLFNILNILNYLLSFTWNSKIVSILGKHRYLTIGILKKILLKQNIVLRVT